MSDGASVPSNFREVIVGLQRRVAVLERSLDKRARQSQVDTLDKYVDKLVAGGAPPTGSLTMWSALLPPSGWLIANGQAVSRTTYADLFAIIGTTYGAGNGSTTFNVPNLKGRVPVGYDPSQTEFDALGETGGAKTHTLTTGEMPVHTHAQNSHTHTQASHTHSLNGLLRIMATNATSAASGTTDNGGSSVASGHTAGRFAKDLNIYTSSIASDETPTINQATATNQNAGGGGAHNNLQPYIVMQYIIKA